MIHNPVIVIPLKGKREEIYTFENYIWTEHISRKLGLWWRTPRSILAAFKIVVLSCQGCEREN